MCSRNFKQGCKISLCEGPNVLFTPFIRYKFFRRKDVCTKSFSVFSDLIQPLKALEGNVWNLGEKREEHMEIINSHRWLLKMPARRRVNVRSSGSKIGKAAVNLRCVCHYRSQLSLSFLLSRIWTSSFCFSFRQLFSWSSQWNTVSLSYIQPNPLLAPLNPIFPGYLRCPF